MGFCLHNRKEVLSRTIPCLYTKNKLNSRVVLGKFVPVYGCKKSVTGLFFLLVPIFSQSLFTLVNRHFMPFSFFSAWHLYFSLSIKLFGFLYLSNKRLGRLESWNIVFGDDNRGIF